MKAKPEQLSLPFDVHEEYWIPLTALLAAVNGHTTSHFTPVHRLSGLVELQCDHGCGHPSKRLTPPTVWAGWMWTHGCDGCCSLGAFDRAEAALAEHL